MKIDASKYRNAAVTLSTAIFLLVFLNVSAVTAGEVIVESKTAVAGDTVVIAIKSGSEGFYPVGVAAFILGYDTTYLDATTVSGTGVLKSFFPNILEAQGEARVGSISLSGETIPGNATIFTVTFVVNTNAPGGEIPIILKTADIKDTSDPTPIPIPTTVVNGSIKVVKCSPDSLKGCISGQVTGSGGQPVERATVVLKREDFPGRKNITDSNGYYYFDNLDDGTYRVKPRRKGTKWQTATVSGGSKPEVNFQSIR